MKNEGLGLGHRWARRFCVGLLLFSLSSFFLFSCSRDTVCDTPFGEGATIDIGMPDFVALQNVGGTMTVNRGYKGIIVRCDAVGSYVAFEMACPLDHVRMVPDDRDYAVKLTCPTCQSSFDIIYGNPLTGSATPCPLYQYNTVLDGRYLSIW